MPITSVTGTLNRSTVATINGSGFGGSTGTLLFFSVNGDLATLTPTSWNNTTITVTIPSNADLTGDATSFFVAVPLGVTVGLKSDPFQVLPVAVSTTQYPNGTLLFWLLNPLFAHHGQQPPVVAPFTVSIGKVASGTPTDYTCDWYSGNQSSPSITVSATNGELQGIAGSASLAFLSSLNLLSFHHIS